MKIIIKNYKQVAGPIVAKMLGEASSLLAQGKRGYHIMISLIDVLLFLPSILDDQELPLTEVQNIMNMLSESKNYRYLARIIRKYFTYFNSQTQRFCLETLVTVASTPINDMSSSEIVYQSALALKSCMSDTTEFDSVSETMFIPCITNLLKIVKEKYFITNPTLLWPIINLIIRLISCLAVCGSIDNTSILIVSELSGLIAAGNNEELVASALMDLLSSIMHTVFQKIKEEYPMPNQPHVPSGVETINPNCLFIFEGVTRMVEANLHNRAL